MSILAKRLCILSIRSHSTLSNVSVPQPKLDLRGFRIYSKIVTSKLICGHCFVTPSSSPSVSPSRNLIRTLSSTSTPPKESQDKSHDSESKSNLKEAEEVQPREEPAKNDEGTLDKLSSIPGVKGGEIEEEIVYIGQLSEQMNYLKMFSLGSSLMGLGMQVMYFQHGIGEMSKGLFVVGLGFLSIFTYVTPILIHLLARRYITELKYNQPLDTYTATYISFFLRRVHFQFRAEDIVNPELPGPFTTFLVKTKDGKKRPVFLAHSNFLQLEHYGRFMGYDKPVDFYLDPKEFEKAMNAIKKKGEGVKSGSGNGESSSEGEAAPHLKSKRKMSSKGT